jgi:2-polyprenyl-3-methyl-5-hydroxy-6-metoxy-1,4-benzoquinol methylase
MAMSSADAVDFACPICASKQARWAAEHRDLRVARCDECGHGYVWPVPDAAFVDTIYRDAGYYQGSECSIGFRDYASLEPARRRMYGRHLMKIESEIGTGRILDVGCATGDFLRVARDRGWKVFGADPSAARAQVEAAGIPLVGSTIDDADIEPASLDAVTFWDVLEHVADPVAGLDRARTLLRPGGVIALTVPDSANLLARISGRRWFGYKTAGEHLQFFAAKSLCLAFEKAQLTLRTRRSTTWSCTLGFLADRAGLYLGPPGRLVRAGLSRANLGSVVVDVPQVNQFAMGIAQQVPAPLIKEAQR